MSFLGTAGEYESRIKRGLLSFRSKRLDAVVKAIADYIKGPSEDNLTAIETAVETWREKDPKEYADRGSPLEQQLANEIREQGEKYWGEGTIRLVDRASNPKYEPHIWNGNELIKLSTNCYAYACNDPYGHPYMNKPQPGQF